MTSARHWVERISQAVGEAAAQGREVDSQQMLSLLGDPRLAAIEWAPYLTWAAKKYTRNLLYRDALCELLVVAWEPGSASSIHDHAGQQCFMAVQVGALALDSYFLLDPGKAGHVGSGIFVRREPGTVHLRPGMLDRRDEHHAIHRVRNPAAWQTRAISLHVYTKPIDTCIVYAPRQGRAVRQPMQVAAGPIAVSPHTD